LWGLAPGLCAGDIETMNDTLSSDAAPDTASGAPANEPDPRLLEILVCPVTRGALVYDRERQELISRAAGLAYPVRDGFPIMIPDDARELTDDET